MVQYNTLLRPIFDETLTVDHVGAAEADGRKTGQEVGKSERLKRAEKVP